MDGILNVWKEPGFTSFDVVAKLRGICKQKKIGHTGTLDPDASGVLPVCLGNATKLCDMLTEKTKEYRARLLLGVETDTQDTSGTVLRECTPEASPERVRDVILSFVGEYDQIPPMYSALKVNGQKLVDLARAGKTVERKSRRITFYSIEIEEIDLPYVTMTVCCSKGTYIRTLCHDIGEKLDCGGCMAHLVRTRSGQFEAKDAYRLSEIEALAKEGRLSEIILPTEAVFEKEVKAVVKPEFEVLALNGNPLLPGQLCVESMQPMASQAKREQSENAESAENAENAAGQQMAERLRVYAGGRFIGVYDWNQEKRQFRPAKMFLN